MDMRRWMVGLCLCGVPFCWGVSDTHAFAYDLCMEDGGGTRYETMPRQHWMAQSKEWRARICADTEDELRALQEARQDQTQRRAIIETERSRRQAALERRQACAKYGTCSSSSEDIVEQINRSKVESQRTVTAGRLTEGRDRLIILEEIREPATSRQPEISLDADRSSAVRYIQIAAVGLRPPAQLLLICGNHSLSVQLTVTRQDNNRTVAIYEVARQAASMVLASGCDLSVGAARIPIEPQQLAPVWGRTQSSSSSKP